MIIIPLLFLALSCSSVHQQLESGPFYKRDIKICEATICHDGVAVLPSKFNYDLDIFLKGKANLFTVTTCARNSDQEDAWIKKIFPDKNRVQLLYTPNKIENDLNCPVLLGGYEKIEGRHSWGMVLFEEPVNYKLNARVFCNGATKDYGGVSACQSKEGLFQEIHLPKGTVFEKEKNCPDLIEIKPGEFRYEIGLKECVYTFIHENKLHKHISVGYEKILIRGD